MSEAAMLEPAICEPGGRGIIFPLTQAEHEWNDLLRVVLYILALLYLFYGVNIAADKFMSGIEEITSSKRVIETKDGRIVTVPVWNDTMATLTLLALGSSAPEILLSVVEILGAGFHAGELGPSTIVGSAAFNLFMIVGVCIYSIDSSEVRRIKEFGVYVVTAAFSVFAYFWLVFIVQISSPDVIQIWEAVGTLALFPLLLAFSYLVDVGYWPSLKSPQHAPPLPPPAHAPGQAGKTPRFGPGSQLMAEADAGVLGFSKEKWDAFVGTQEIVETIPVYRTEGSRGAVSCKYRMEGRTAVPGHDFRPSEGELTWAEGATRNEICVNLMPKRLGEHSDRFQIILEDPEGGARFDPGTDGGEERCVLTVTVRNENDRLVRQSKVLRASRAFDNMCNLDACRAGAAVWKQEIYDAVFNIGDDDDDDDEDQDGKKGDDDGENSGPSASDYFWYIVGLPWRVAISILVPPPQFLGGWICFSFALLTIGAITAFIIDFAELFGCIAEVEDSITAITLVALGTSMPDLFASVTAAGQEEYADASIVNVTGSNSVNVFLGIGLPWLMASIYWTVDQAEWNANFAGSGFPVGSFIVKGGDLAFSVLVFTVGALVFFVALKLRRDRCGGEFGGPYGLKVASTGLLVLIWLFYISLSIWKVLAGDVGVWSQVGALGVGVVVLENVMMFAGVVLYFSGYLKEKDVEFNDLEAPVEASKLGQEMSPHQYSPHWPPMTTAQETPQWASHMSGLRGAGTQHAVTCQPRVLGAHAPTDNKITFSGAAMVLWAAARFKMRAPPHGDRRHRRFIEDSGGSLRRSNSFHSCEGPSAGGLQGERASTGRLGDRVANFLGHNATDWIALSFAGLAARQLACP